MKAPSGQPTTAELSPAARGRARSGGRSRGLRQIRQGWQLYVLLLLPLLYLAVFHYWPMYGVQIAFRNYNVVAGITGSPWAGLKHFERFVNSYLFWPIISNTVILSVYALLASFPLPIMLALALNYVGRAWFRRMVQTVTYAPYFISTVVMVGMIFLLLDPRIGIVNFLLRLVGIDAINFMGVPAYFRHIFVWSDVWQTVGFSAVVYLAALAGVDPTLHEAAIVDGASKLQRIRYIDLPGIAPVAMILLILSMGSILNVGFEKVLLMQNPLNLQTSEVIDTYVYKQGLAGAVPQYSYAAAIGLFKSIVGLILLATANQIARNFSENSLW